MRVGPISLILTGQLGDVMKESARAALTYATNNADAARHSGRPARHATEAHIHVPAGAIPKDGPSAGIAIATALVSEMSNRKVRRDVAMTGEITLRGRVLPIGGIKEKVLGAHRAGITTVILPEGNEATISRMCRTKCVSSSRSTRWRRCAKCSTSRSARAADSIRGSAARAQSLQRPSPILRIHHGVGRADRRAGRADLGDRESERGRLPAVAPRDRDRSTGGPLDRGAARDAGRQRRGAGERREHGEHGRDVGCAGQCVRRARARRRDPRPAPASHLRLRRHAHVA
jgi:hypothetical protein